MPAPDAPGFPGQLELAPGFATIVLGGRSHLSYGAHRTSGAGFAAGELVLCLVVRDRSDALRATLRRLAGVSRPSHRVLVVDGGSADWSFSDAIAHAAAHDNTVVLQSARGVALGALYADALQLVGSGTAVLVPPHPEIAAVALKAFASALETATDARAAIPGEREHVVHGDDAAATVMRGARVAPAPLMALRGPVVPSAGLARCTTAAGVALALCGDLRRAPCAVTAFPPITGWPAEGIPPGDLRAALSAIEPPWPSAIRHAAAALGGELPTPAAVVAIEHPDTWVDEDTHALADALDRAGVLGDEEGARWTIRWLPSPAGHVRSGHGGTALRLALSEPEPPADARGADLLLVASEADATTCVAAGVPAAQLAVVPPVVDTLRFRPGTAPLRLGQEGTFAFLLVTRWGGRQGWDRVVAAYLRAFGARDRTSLVIVVVGLDIPSEEQAGAEILALIEAADRHEDDLPDIALHTTLPLERLPSIHAGADCLVVPAADGWGTRTAIEGMASGLPVIAPLNPVLAGALDGSSGVPLPDRWDETDLAQELADAASDPAHAARLGAEARRRAVATWSGGRAAAAAIRALGLPAPRELHDGP